MGKAMSIAANILGKNIAAWRDKSGLTQVAFATMMGVAPSAVAHWETGRSMPGGDLLDLLCQTMGVTHAELLSNSGFEFKPISAPVREVSVAEALRVVNRNISKLVIKKKSK
jgi:transcriptional regulator with XRE-family HTH domain